MKYDRMVRTSFLSIVAAIGICISGATNARAGDPVLGGPGGPVLPSLTAYCNSTGVCCETALVTPCCTDWMVNGEPPPPCTGQGFPSVCWGVRACCLPNGTCADMDAICCDDFGGVPGGSGSSCAGSTEACCFDPPDNLCSDLDPVCCGIQSGAPAGPGTECADSSGLICSLAYGCCNGNHPDPGDLECPNHRIYECVINHAGETMGEVCSGGDDIDEDGVHDLCDVCPLASTDDEDGDGFCDNADNCNSTDHNCTGSGCANPGQEDCDGDEIGDICDDDIDGDGVSNDDDICDFTPVGQIPLGKTVNAEGTLPGDLDGDCDVDANDLAILNSFTTGSGTCSNQ